MVIAASRVPAVLAGLLLGTTAGADVPSAYAAVATRHDIPPALFYAIALTESGRSIEVLKARRPWPWTLNIAGEGSFYPDRIAAWRALDEALINGQTRVDIGLMQVNWRYHGARLENSWLAMEPAHNLEVAAEILRECYAKRRDWWASVGCYHAPNHAERAARYTARVRAAWQAVKAED